MAVLGRRGAIALTCAAVLAMPAAALANAYDDTLRDYRTTGAVDGCKYTAEQLAQAKAQTPTNIKDVAPGYPAQLDVAAAKRAKGCTKAEEKAASTTTSAAGATTGTTGTGTTATGAATQPPATTTIAPNATTTAATLRLRLRRRQPRRRRPPRHRPPRTRAPASRSSSWPRCC